MLKYALLLALGILALWMWRRANPRTRQVVGALLLVALAVAVVFLVVLPLLDPGG
ncbi:MAG: hypothetical protein JWR64_427 [Marmoricola sp.]|nr:hypothetical protein [Marmoricola sp.]